MLPLYSKNSNSPQNPLPKLNRNPKWNSRMGKLSLDSCFQCSWGKDQTRLSIAECPEAGSWAAESPGRESQSKPQEPGRAPPCSTLRSRGGSSLLPLSKCKLQWLALSAHSLAQRKHLPISRQKRSEFPNPNAGGTFHSTIFQLAPLHGEMLHQNKSSQLVLADWNETWHCPRRRMP